MENLGKRPVGCVWLTGLLIFTMKNGSNKWIIYTKRCRFCSCLFKTVHRFSMICSKCSRRNFKKPINHKKVKEIFDFLVEHQVLTRLDADSLYQKYLIRVRPKRWENGK